MAMLGYVILTFYFVEIHYNGSLSLPDILAVEAIHPLLDGNSSTHRLDPIKKCQLAALELKSPLYIIGPRKQCIVGKPVA